MPRTVSQIFKDALKLSDDSRIELAERLIESTCPSSDLLGEQLAIVRQREIDVQNGSSSLISADEARRRILEDMSDKS